MSRNKSAPASHRDIAHSPLERVVREIFPKQSNQHGRQDAFMAGAIILAEQYAKRRQPAYETESRRKRYEAVALAAQQLRFAMEGLYENELDILAIEQRKAFGAYVGEVDYEDYDDFERGYTTSDEPFKARSVHQMLKWQDLRWLEQGARRQCAPRRRGRPENTAERWAARRFVFLCHKHGWSPVRVAHNGSERQQGDPQPSDAVICLAAIFVAGGANEIQAMSLALSALKQLRHTFTILEGPDGPFDGVHNSEEDIRYTVSLKELIRDADNNLGDVPNFIPEGVRPPEIPGK